MMDAKPRVLLVEDTPLLRDAYVRLLRSQGFDVREATNGREALGEMTDFDPQLVLTDLMMPEMGGIEFIRRLRADPHSARVPIVAITANPSALAERQAREAGADDFLTKPLDMPVLLDRLRALRN